VVVVCAKLAIASTDSIAAKVMFLKNDFI